MCEQIVLGQDVSWEDFANLYFHDYDDEDTESTSQYEELLELHRTPININLAQRSDLVRLPFLNGDQCDSILSLIKQSYGLYSLGELSFVKNLTRKEIMFMPLFFYCERLAKPDTLKTRDRSDRWVTDVGKLSTQISTTLTIPLYKREGFKSHSIQELAKNPNKQYLGNNLSTTLRYRSSYYNRIYWGLTAQKDEGEPFASKGNTLYDSYSFYLFGKGKGVIRQWVVGDYRAQFGLGLTVGSATIDATNIMTAYNPRQHGFIRHTSTDEALFMRGGAIALQAKRLNLYAFVSCRQLDATLNKDSISTILTDGYHRTPLEMSKRHNIQSLQGGVSAVVDMSPLTLGVQATHTHYDTPYRTPTALYRKYYFRGKDFGNYSMYYAYRNGPFKMWGETATSIHGGIATQNRLQYAPSYRFKVNLLHRYYSTHYLSTSAQSYKIGSRIQNEHGLLFSINGQLTDFWSLQTYADYAHYPFAIYQTCHASNAFTGLLQLTYAPQTDNVYLLRYKYRSRPQDNKQHLLSSKQTHSLKLQVRYKAGSVPLTTTADLMFVSQPDKSNTSGWMLSQKASAKIHESTSLNVAIALFHTDSYAEALRLYENVLLYSSAFPSLYYHGQRFSLSAVHKWHILHFALKYSAVHYTNRSSISSGLRAYKGSTLQDLQLQIALKF